MILITLEGIPHALPRINAALQEVCSDVRQRPAVKKARTLVIEVQVTPDIDAENGVNYPYVEVVVSRKLPKQRIAKATGMVDGEDVLVEEHYQADLEDPAQPDNVTRMAGEGGNH